MALTRLLADRPDLPVVAAGGVMDGHGVRAMIELGAVAARLGTAFAACPESGADDAFRAALAGSSAEHAAPLHRPLPAATVIDLLEQERASGRGGRDNGPVTATTNDPLCLPAPDPDLDVLHACLGSSWGLAGELTPLHGERDRNFRLDTVAGRYLLKVYNPADGEAVLDLQRSALRHIRAVDPDLPVPDVVPTQDGRGWLEVTGRDGRRSLAWVMTWLEGRHPTPADLAPAQLRDWGRTAARLGRALRGFVHPAAAYPIAWDIRRLPQLRPWLSAVDAGRRPTVEAVLDRFERRVVPDLAALRAQVVHNDLAPGNVLVDDSSTITGITDFGDMTHTALVCDVAVAASDGLSGREDGLQLVPEFLAGYHSVTPLEPGELALVADLMAARNAAAILITAWRTREQGWAPQIDDEAYHQLGLMLDVGLDALTGRFTTALRTGTPGPSYGGGGLPYPRRATEELLDARARSLGGLELSYARPVHLVGGRGVFLEAVGGRRYLDAYNNVPVLGHSHPAVVDAVCSQLATLNTNSRYLQEAPVELAERLLATLPDRFDRVLLVNSGSEANDLAWRIARHATGAAGGIATSWAYHGVTEATYAFSPESWGTADRPAHMRLVEPPPGPLSAVPEAAEDLHAAGLGVAAMLVDGVFTSDGIHGPAHDWTSAAAAAVHDAGGLYVADEVQAGHGRTGDSLWSFVAGDVPADLVTLGKPMGNGYPVAAVAGPADLVDPFLEGTDYFSTFGGGTAACAAALAVLRTLAEDRVVDRVAAVGAHLVEALREVTADRAEVAGVRGWGLAVGADVVDPATGRPDPQRTGRIVDGMRERGVLIGRTGPGRNTLKIRPPLVFGDEHVDLLTDALTATLAALR
ncbi:aminotransferase class III-fold pyridoxal phosphate-dependent enzyme [Segeticoccus rhizosphaerae]|uniref:aminotransferase class III-fold pyridoxal phosphate-dependent enzyme n=1 Tax=Segeticoccus rhizosphaerae TaxID=1104777 RepID=UPI002367FC68|nr:aminotransferase class III-fold pyridoxal phosphate-dependent enzyme [Ornithinicoccus soli]